MTNYLMLNDVKIEIEEEDAEKIKNILLENKKNYFDRVVNSTYYYIDCCGNVQDILDNNYEADNDCYDIGNYCTNKEMMEKRALTENLSRLLWRFSLSNNGEIKWGGKNSCNFKISYNHDIKDFVVDYNVKFQNCLLPYFSTKEIAQRAIEEVIKPFMEKHPNFII